MEFGQEHYESLHFPCGAVYLIRIPSDHWYQASMPQQDCSDVECQEGFLQTVYLLELLHGEIRDGM